jgi:hypothetical protein
MANDEKNTRLISGLYSNYVNVEQDVELMQDQNIHDEQSTEVENSMERFHYYNFELNQNFSDYVFSYWTSRYLLTCRNYSPNPAFHEIEIFDLFNDKST